MRRSYHAVYWAVILSPLGLRPVTYRERCRRNPAYYKKYDYIAGPIHEFDLIEHHKPHVVRQILAPAEVRRAAYLAFVNHKIDRAELMRRISCQ